MFKKLCLSFTALSLVASLSGCQDSGGDTDSSSGSQHTESSKHVEDVSQSNSNEKQATDNVDKKVSKDNPIFIDETEKAIYLAAEVNGDAIESGTQHGIVSQNGKNADVSLFHSYIEPSELYDALINLGAEPGDNLTMEDLKLPEGEGKSVEGTSLNISLSWEGQDEIPFSDVLLSENEGIMTADFKFGGNLEANTEMGTGCTVCLYSCPIGTISNASIPTDELADLKVYGDEDVLPKDGSAVIFKITLAE